MSKPESTGTEADWDEGNVQMWVGPKPSPDLNARYTSACKHYHDACRAVELAEVERDAARDECKRLEAEMGLS